MVQPGTECFTAVRSDNEVCEDDEQREREVVASGGGGVPGMIAGSGRVTSQMRFRDRVNGPVNGEEGKGGRCNSRLKLPLMACTTSSQLTLRTLTGTHV